MTNAQEIWDINLSLNILGDFKIRQLLDNSDHCPFLFSLRK